MNSQVDKGNNTLQFLTNNNEQKVIPKTSGWRKCSAGSLVPLWFIYPTPDWKTLTLKNFSAHEFDVDQYQFYIDVTLD